MNAGVAMTRGDVCISITLFTPARAQMLDVVGWDNGYPSYKFILYYI